MNEGKAFVSLNNRANQTSSLAHAFDAVIMLTWSDWHTEPRSNRYHYASRFATQLPVFFVQPDGMSDEIVFEPVEGTLITLVHIKASGGPELAVQLRDSLHARGMHRLLAWVYNVFFDTFATRLAPVFTVFHATEDYVGPIETIRGIPGDIAKDVQNLLECVDMIVAVSEGVADSYRQHGGFDRFILVLENGCDYPFWERTGASNYAAPPNGAKVAFYQGGINQRLDYELLSGLVNTLSDWQFWFCGKSVDAGMGWAALKLNSNVRDFGIQSSEGIAKLAQQSLVGLIPFRRDSLMRRSLPLKAYEYLACGLPVVTIPIDALVSRPDIFTTANDLDEFVAATRALGKSRTDSVALARRLEAAQFASDDHRFVELCGAIATQLSRRAKLRPRLNVLVLYDDGSTHVRTIREHLESLHTYSRHHIHFLPATGFVAGYDDAERLPDFSVYDAIVLHYSVRVSVTSHLSEALAQAIAAYRGPKLLFVQDEYENTEIALRWIERLQIDAVFTNVPTDGLEKIYPRARFPNVDFLPTLTGYVPEDPSIESFVTPMAERRTLIGYRGRQLPHHYGVLGYDKFRIGVDMKRLAQGRGLQVDIETALNKRIYGLDWYRFIGSCRATLGTESGCNVFDFDGSLKELAAKHHDMPFTDFAARYLGPHEGLVRMNQISPKIFEAIRLRTALILFDGEYSGVVRSNEHYIPLKHDYSNVDEVFSKLQDLDYLEVLTTRAYRDVVDSGRHSYETFVKGVDSYLDTRATGRRRTNIISAPLVAIYSRADSRPLWSNGKAGLFPSNVVLGNNLSREKLIKIASAQIGAWEDLNQSHSKTAIAKIFDGVARTFLRLKRPIWQRLPLSFRIKLLSSLRDVVRDLSKHESGNLWKRILRFIWRSLPTTIRAGILRNLN